MTAGAMVRRLTPFLDEYIEDLTASVAVLTVEVSYSDGCGVHEFALTAADAFRGSADAVQLTLVLTHDANEDPCEAYPAERLRFDLSPIGTRYRAAYGQDSGSVLLQLSPAPATKGRRKNKCRFWCAYVRFRTEDGSCSCVAVGPDEVQGRWKRTERRIF